MKYKLTFILINLIACTFCDGHWKIEGLEIERGLEFKELSIPINNSKKSEVIVVLKSERIYVGSKKFDFISINPVPEVIFQDVSIKILKLKEDKSELIWTDLIKEFAIKNMIFKNGEIRKISFFSQKSGLFLTGGEGRFDKNLTYLEIRTNVLIQGVNKSLRSVRVMLDGPMKGNMVWEEDGVIHVKPVA